MEEIKTQLIAGLKDAKSSIRRKSAQKLRKLESNEVCDYLKEALLEEIGKKTWETQYQMVMAIGESQCIDCRESLYQILQSVSIEPMVKMAISDAITRIENSTAFLIKTISTSNDIDHIEGALRAIVILKLPLPEHIIIYLTNLIEPLQNRDTKFWLAAGAVTWKSTFLKGYLHKWENSKNIHLANASKNSLENKTTKFSIL